MEGPPCWAHCVPIFPTLPWHHSVDSYGTFPICSVHRLSNFCAALRSCLRRLFCSLIFLLSSPVASLFESTSRGGARPFISAMFVSVFLASQHHSFCGSLNVVRLFVFGILPCPPYMSSVFVLKIPLGGAPLVAFPIVSGALVRDVASPPDSVLINFFAITVSNGPSVAASRFSPDVWCPPFVLVCLFVFP
jgi:hypothetical protein